MANYSDIYPLEINNGGTAGVGVAIKNANRVPSTFVARPAIDLADSIEQVDRAGAITVPLLSGIQELEAIPLQEVTQL